jgi:hypothetical protein
MQVVKAGVLYFALVFGAGFVLGTVRTLWFVPRVGVRTAELMEMPIMLAVTIVAARWTVPRFRCRRCGLLDLGWVASHLSSCSLQSSGSCSGFGVSRSETISPRETPFREQPITCCLLCSPSCLFSLGNDNVAHLRVRRGRPFWRPRH